MRQPEAKKHESSSSPTPVRVLLVDDNDVSRITTKWFLSNFGYAVESVGSAEEGLRVFDPALHEVVITDNSLLGMTGAELAEAIKARSPRTRILMYTGNPPENRSCLDSVIQRPAHLLEIKDMVDRLLAMNRLEPCQSPPPDGAS